MPQQTAVRDVLGPSWNRTLRHGIPQGLNGWPMEEQ